MKVTLAKARNLTRLPAIPSLLEVVCRATGLGLAMIAEMTGDQWIACGVRDEMSFGLHVGDALPAEMTLCFEAERRERPVVINDLAADPTNAGNSIFSGGRFRSYISEPIVLADGRFFGALCALGTQPARLDAPEVVGMFKLFAGIIANQLDNADQIEESAANLRSAVSDLDISETGRQDAEERLAASAADLTHATSRLAESDAALLDAQATAALREQFVAILGHDLRNPLAAMMSGLTLLRRSTQDERGTRILGMMEQSAARMGELIKNMLDFAMTQLGSGITLRREQTNLEPVLNHVISELQARNPQRCIDVQIDLMQLIDCDPSRIGQMLSNLLANALTHGAAEHPVTVRAAVDDDRLAVSVANGGKPIPAETMAGLFKPYVRGTKTNAAGLGLGLFIAASIARAHGGTLTASSTQEETQFVFSMPSGGFAHATMRSATSP